MTASVETQLALLSHKVTQAVDGMTRVERSQEELTKSQSELGLQTGQQLFAFNARLEAMDARLSAASPTIDEFIRFRQRIQGAGILGKWLWISVGALIGLLASARQTIFSWLSGT